MGSRDWAWDAELCEVEVAGFELILMRESKVEVHTYIDYLVDCQSKVYSTGGMRFREYVRENLVSNASSMLTHPVSSPLSTIQ